MSGFKWDARSRKFGGCFSQAEFFHYSISLSLYHQLAAYIFKSFTNWLLAFKNTEDTSASLRVLRVPKWQNYQSILGKFVFIFSHFLKKIVPVFSCSLFAFWKKSHPCDLIFSWLTKSSPLLQTDLNRKFKNRLFYLDEHSWWTHDKLFPDSCQMRQAVRRHGHWRGSNMGVSCPIDEKCWHIYRRVVGGLWVIGWLECQTVTKLDLLNSILRNTASWITYQSACLYRFNR